MFNHQVINHPDKVAFIEGDRSITYLQLQQQVTQLSWQLSTNNKKNQRIVIALDRGIDAAIAILACLNIGCCYIPLDIKNPENRLRFIVNDADVQCVIGKGSCPAWLDKPELWFDFNQPKTTTTSSLSTNIIKAETLAAILYTSGSTGNPKGVALSHEAIANFYNWAASTFKITETDNIASLTPFHFDLSIFDLFTSLTQGATVHFVPANLTFSPSRLTGWLSENHISVWYTVPSLLSFIALKGALTSTPLPQLRSILFAGEVFPTQQLIKLCQLLPETEFYNLYGPTETNVCCYWPVNRNQLDSNQAIPIGLSAGNAELKISADDDQLLVKSRNNLSGYWQQGKLHPVKLIDGYYPTGDKVSLNSKGEYCYHGRLDRMLKCSGYRVEPAEIELLIQHCDEVINCVIIGIKDSTSGQRPAAALVLKKNENLAGLVKKIRQKLPTYMQPCKYIVLDSIPYLSNGKTDYQLLHKQLEQA